MPAVRMPASQPISADQARRADDGAGEGEAHAGEAQRQQGDHADAADGERAELDHRCVLLRPSASAISSFTCVSMVMSFGTATGSASGWAIMRR